MSKIKGVDVSYHRGYINWKKAKADGVKFAILREGYRRSIDSQFLNNVKNASANDVFIMVYHFIYTDGATPKQNAESTVANMKKAGLDPTNTWVWCDLEYDTWVKNRETCTREKCSKYTQQYIDGLKALGVTKIGIYMNQDYYKNYYSIDLIQNYPVWLADYEGDPNYPCAIQQYSSKGSVNGISGNVDMNYLYDLSIMSGEPVEKKEDDKPTEAQLRNSVARFLEKYLGISEGSALHKELLAIFNNSGLCTRYKMTVNDPWCATGVSAVFIALGLAGKPNSGSLFECVECSCPKMIELAKKQGIWEENDAYVPDIADIIMYDWQDTTGSTRDNTGVPDHVGIISQRGGNTLKVIECNKEDTVTYRTIKVNGDKIRGYILPRYADFASKVTPSEPVTPSPTPSEPEVKKIVADSKNTFKISGSGTPNKSKVQFTGTVTASSLNVRTWAGTENKTCSFSPLKKGTKVKVYDAILAPNNSTWYYISYGGKYGFVSSNYIE